VLALVLAASVLGALTLAKVDKPSEDGAMAEAGAADQKEGRRGA